MIYRWVNRDGVMHLQGREAGHRHTVELGTVTNSAAGFTWETADGFWGATEPTMKHAMRELERRARR